MTEYYGQSDSMLNIFGRSNVSMAPAGRGTGTGTEPPCVAIHASAQISEISPQFQNYGFENDDYWEEVAHTNVCFATNRSSSLPYHLLWDSWTPLKESSRGQATQRRHMIIISMSATQKVDDGVLYEWEKTVVVDPNELAVRVSIPMSHARREVVHQSFHEEMRTTAVVAETVSVGEAGVEVQEDRDVLVTCQPCLQIPTTLLISLLATAMVFCSMVFLLMRRSSKYHRPEDNTINKLKKSDTKDVACSPFVQVTEGWQRQRDGRLRRGNYKPAAMSETIMPQLKDEE